MLFGKIKIVIALLILCLSISFNAYIVMAVSINEIMYNPEGQDNNNEYIEIITNISLEGFIIQDSASSDVLELLQQSNFTYALIVEEGFNYSGINASIYSAGSTIGNNLNNDEDFIIIKDNSTILDVFHYYNYLGAEGNGKSLCKLPDNIGIWQECQPTPGSENSQPNIDYTIKISEFLPDPEGYDDAPMPEGEWIELFNYGEISLDLSNAMLKDNFGRKLIISSTTTFNQIIQPESYLVVYTNGLFGFLNNEDFEKITLYDPNNILLEEVSYSRSEEGNSWSNINGIWKITKPSPGKENNNEDVGKDSKIEIKAVYLGKDNKAYFGDVIRVKIKAYKGDTTKNTIEAYVEKDGDKASKVSSVNIEKKYSNITLTIPIATEKKCRSNKNEIYKLVIEGLETQTSEDITLESSQTCENQEKVEKTETKFNTKSENVINKPEEPITINVTNYESVSETSNRFAIYFFSLVLILILVRVIRKNGKY